MSAQEIPEAAVVATARDLSPHLWDGRLERALTRMTPLFTPEQARVAAEKKREERLDEVRAVLTAAWKQLFPVVTTAKELDALPAGIVVRSADGTVACRHYSGVGVVFGDERPFDWLILALPATVLYRGDAP